MDKRKGTLHSTYPSRDPSPLILPGLFLPLSRSRKSPARSPRPRWSLPAEQGCGKAGQGQAGMLLSPTPGAGERGRGLQSPQPRPAGRLTGAGGCSVPLRAPCLISTLIIQGQESPGARAKPCAFLPHTIRALSHLPLDVFFPSLSFLPSTLSPLQPPLPCLVPISSQVLFSPSQISLFIHFLVPLKPFPSPSPIPFSPLPSSHPLFLQPLLPFPPFSLFALCQPVLHPSACL